MKEFNAENTGNRVVINVASLAEVKRLKQVIVSEMSKHPLGIKLLGSGEVLDRQVDISGVLEFIKNVVLKVECSDEFDDAIFDCLKHCTYKTTYQITRDLFESDKCIEAREDYYEIIFECIEENLRPFIKSLISTFKTKVANNTLIQKLSSM